MDLFDIDDAKSENEKFLRIRELEKLIKKYQASYYNDKAEISDYEFDLLWDELKSLDPNNSVLKKIGTDSGDFEKAEHIMMMGSQEKASSPEAFMQWANKHVYNEYLVEYKLDGASLELQYTNGTLTKAVTRGNGIVGDDITSNALKMQGVLKELKVNDKIVDFTGGIRGEVIMTHQVHKNYFSDKANCRNAANGLMKRKNASGQEHLTVIVYDALELNNNNPFETEIEKIDWLKKFGFITTEIKICKNAQEVIEYREEVTKLRKDLDFDIDGLVIKENKIDLLDARRNRPDRQIAFKFNLEEAVTVIKEVEWSISGTTYTPVAIFEPVELAGTTVQRASLCNPDTLKSLNVKIGSTVVVVKRGEIIPKIEKVLDDESVDTGLNSSLREIALPTKCEVCGTTLTNAGSKLFCPNKKCKKRVLHQIQKWIECLDIREFGETLVNALFNDSVIQSISDIYKLTEKDLVPYFLSEESQKKVQEGQLTSLGAAKVYNSIHSKVNVTLQSFVAGFDIEGIGETMLEKAIEAGFDTLDKLLTASVEDFTNIYMFAEITATTLYEGLQENANEMKSLVDNKIITIESNENKKLQGISFCFTGELVTMKRQDAQILVKDNGGQVKSSVTKDLTYLVTNDTSSGSSKNEKAKKFGIKIITEKEFLEIVQ